MKRSDLPSLDDLRAFDVVARHGSVRAAAEQLALSHGAVSRRINKLARDLDLVLFEPDGRGIRLTAAGGKLATATGAAIDLLTDALADIRVTSPDGPFVLSCERSVAMRWLIPRLSGFQDAYPELPVHLSVGGGSLDFSKNKVTLAIRRLDFAIDPGWIVQVLMTETVGPVMVPAMVERFRSGRYVGLGSATRPAAWSAWLSAHTTAPGPAEIRMMDHHFLIAEAAASGLGVALCPRILAADDLARGRLVAPLGFSEDGTDYGLIYRNSQPLTSAFTTVRDWVIEMARQTSTSELEPVPGAGRAG